MKILDEEIASETSGMSGHRDIKSRAEDFTKTEPMQALGAAAGTGLLFAVLPVGRILWGLFRMSFKLAKPALLIFGAVAVYQELSRRAGTGDGPASFR